MQSGEGRTLERRTENVGVLQRTVGLHDHHGGRGDSDSFDPGATTEQAIDDGLEQSDAGPGVRLVVPAIEDRPEPVRVRGVDPGDVRPESRTPRWGRRPVGVRQQEVDSRRGELPERVESGQRRVAKVHGAQQPTKQVPVRLGGQPGEGGLHSVVAPPAPRAPPMPVVGNLITVHTDPDPDPELAKEPQHGLVQQQSVGLNGQVQRGGIAQCRRQPGNGPAQILRPGQQRFTAMEHHVDSRQPMPGGVVGQAVGETVGRVGRHQRRPGPPPLVGLGVHVAVVASEVAAAVDLEDELPQRRPIRHLPPPVSNRIPVCGAKAGRSSRRSIGGIEHNVSPHPMGRPIVASRVHHSVSRVGGRAPEVEMTDESDQISELIDVSGLGLDQLAELPESVLASALRRILTEYDGFPDRYTGFNSQI